MYEGTTTAVHLMPEYYENSKSHTPSSAYGSVGKYCAYSPSTAILAML